MGCKALGALDALGAMMCDDVRWEEEERLELGAGGEWKYIGPGCLRPLCLAVLP